jgi:hypothetical protein
MSVGKDLETSLAIANYGSVVFVAIDAHIIQHVINTSNKTLNTIGFISNCPHLLSLFSASCSSFPHFKTMFGKLELKM